MSVFIVANGLEYEKLRGLALNVASMHQVKNSAGISKVGENKQLLIAIVSNKADGTVVLKSTFPT